MQTGLIVCVNIARSDSAEEEAIRKEGRKEEEEFWKDEINRGARGYVRRRECLGRPFQSSDYGARSVYHTFWNSFS